MNKPVLLLLFALAAFPAFTQNLSAGFRGKEYREMLAIDFQDFDGKVINPAIPVPPGYTIAYRSGETGLSNSWNMWYRADHKVAVISIRGTVGALSSWLENYYAPMIPATGSLQLTDSTTFNYQLAADGKAHVHTGWVVGLGFLAPSIVEQVKKAVGAGITDFIVTGHSQGGALATLATSYLYYLIRKGELPSSIRLKSYCSAAPKPGNLFYAYDYEFITRNGWGYTVLNAADWVPETPFSVQTLADFNPLNPFTDISGLLKKQPFLVRIVLRHKYNKIKRGLHNAQSRFEKDLGGLVYKMVLKYLPELRKPVYVSDNNYQRSGVPVILQPDADYYRQFKDDGTNVFLHHMFAAYFTLSQKYYADEQQ